MNIISEILKDDDPEEPYRRRQDEEKKGISWGQRKLLLSLVSFLSKYLDKNIKNPVVVYAGAAPGINIGIAAKLFPNITWHLYDPAKFKLKTDLTRKIIVYPKKFTDQIAEYWSKHNNIYFISDIRTADYTKLKDLNENEQQILGDMEMQKRWVEIIRPLCSQLKFRLPYDIPGMPDQIEYLDGVIYKTPWSPQTSTETRLVVTNLGVNSPFAYRTYSCQKYQSQLFHHNVIVRETYKFENDCMDPPELLDEFDSCCEVLIWKDYLNYLGSSVSEAGLNSPTSENVIQLSRQATDLLTKNRKYKDTLSYLRDNPRAIKTRNFNRE